MCRRVVPLRGPARGAMALLERMVAGGKRLAVHFSFSQLENMGATIRSYEISLLNPTLKPRSSVYTAHANLPRTT